MLAIRLQRIGRKKMPLYRVIVSEKGRDTQGDHLELLGNYNPHTKVAVFKKERIEHWLKAGAKASPTVYNLFIKEGIIKSAKKAKAVSISKIRAAKNKKEEPKTEPKKAEGPEQSRGEEVKTE